MKKKALDAETLRLLYIRRARINFDKDIILQRKTRIHDVAIKIGMTVEAVEKIWNESSE